MNRETESHFSSLPAINIKRSSFKRPNRHLTTFSCGQLIPIYVDSDIMPGDTVKMEMGEIVRMTTPIFPVMDQAYLDIYFFFVPHRLVWEHWREFWGENRTTHWEQPVTYTIPQITAPAGTGWTQGTLADFMGIPIGKPNISVSHLPFRAYCQIVNDWFVDENLKDPCNYTKDETTVTGANSGTYVTYTEAGALPYKAAKFHDYFTSALPAPQKASSVSIPLGKTAPIVGTDNISSLAVLDSNLVNKQLYVYNSTGGLALNTGDTTVTSLASGKSIGLAADLSNAIGASINTFRQALALQSFYEALARSGSRYTEIIKGVFGVTSPDGRQQRSEYLGGSRININMDQVLQTSSTDAVSPQGNTAAFSCTVDSGEIFTHSFTEHGTLMGLAVVRTDHTYQQGIDRMWSRTKREDFYVPQLASLGEQAILNKEIYAQGSSVVDSDGKVVDEKVFGYQECWAEYRYRQNITSNEMRSNANGTLDAWHYADDYNSLPILESDWIDETVKNMDRTLTVKSTNASQFFGDFYFNATYVRPMPVYSIPATLTHF